MATGSGPKQQDLLVQKNHAQRTPAPCMVTSKSLVLVLKSLAQSGPRLALAMTFCWTLVPSTASARKQPTSIAVIISSTTSPGEN